VLGFDDLDPYVTSDAYFGATCGRYGNRIARGRFRLDGVEHQLDRNEGANHLHGGRAGFERKIWRIAERTESAVTFAAVSEDGEMGYPGRATLQCRYALTGDDKLVIEMRAEADRPTPMNMVHHSYFNLAGQGSGDVLGQEVRLGARFYTPVDRHHIPTGEVLPVAGTPFDFRALKPIGADFAALEGAGYDHNWRLDGTARALHFCAEAVDPASGRRMVLETTEPGVQFYTGGHLSEGVAGKAGRRLGRFAGFALETQKFPDSPNKAHFPSSILRPGETYRHRMVFSFTVNK